MPIEQYQAGPLSNASDARLIYCGSADDREAFEFQVTPHDIGDIPLIFDNQNISVHPAAPRHVALARSWSWELRRPTSVVPAWCARLPVVALRWELERACGRDQ